MSPGRANARRPIGSALQLCLSDIAQGSQEAGRAAVERGEGMGVQVGNKGGAHLEQGFRTEALPGATCM